MGEMEKAQLLMMKGALSDLPPEEKTKILNAKKEIETAIEKYGDAGKIALALCGLEFTAED
jgi:hypothetical protein